MKLRRNVNNLERTVIHQALKAETRLNNTYSIIESGRQTEQSVTFMQIKCLKLFEKELSVYMENDTNP